MLTARIDEPPCVDDCILTAVDINCQNTCTVPASDWMQDLSANNFLTSLLAKVDWTIDFQQIEQF